MHLFKEPPLLDIILSKVAKFNSSNPAFYLDCSSSQSIQIQSFLSPLCTLTDLSQDFEIFASPSQLPDHKEGSRIYLEEEGNMVYDEDLQRNLVGYVHFVDPRSRYLGSRIIAVEGCIESNDHKTEEFYKMWRFINGVCEAEEFGDADSEALNFPHFNGKKPSHEKFLACGMIVTNSPNEKFYSEDIADRSYSKKVKGLRIIDQKQNMVGIVHQSFYNLLLIRMVDMPKSQLLLETGEKINFWKPLYMVK